MGGSANRRTRRDGIVLHEPQRGPGGVLQPKASGLTAEDLPTRGQILSRKVWSLILPVLAKAESINDSLAVFRSPSRILLDSLTGQPVDFKVGLDLIPLTAVSPAFPQDHRVLGGSGYLLLDLKPFSLS